MQALRSLTALLFTLAVLVACAADDADTQQVDLSLTITLRHGPPVGQTPQDAAAAGAPPATVFDQGEPIDVAFTISNVGQTPFAYTDRDYDRSGRMNEYAVQVSDQQDRTLEDPRELWGGAWLGGGASGGAEIAPGESFTKHIYLNQWVMPLPPGGYTVVGIYHPDVWAPSEQTAVRSQPAEIQVRPRTEAEMKARIAELALELEATEPERRVQAVRYLGFTGSAHALPYLTSGLYEQGSNVPFRASEAFLYMTDTDACIEALLTTLNERGPARPLQYLLNQYQVPKEQTLAPTVRRLSDPNPAIRAAAAGALGQHHELGDAALDPLLGALKDEDPQVRRAVAGALYNYRMPRASQALLAATEDPDESVRETAARVLGNTQVAAAIPRLRELMEDTRMVARDAVDALVSIGTPEAAEALRSGLQLQEEQIRVRAAIALLRLGDDSTRELIAKALEGGDWRLRQMIYGYLGYAVERRGIPGPGPEYNPYTAGPDAWIQWLRRPPPNP
jgi:HEAT repeat protein